MIAPLVDGPTIRNGETEDSGRLGASPHTSSDTAGVENSALQLRGVDASLWEIEVSLPSQTPASRVPNSIAQAIDESRFILDLGDNWDDEGSPGYERATWDRAAEFLKTIVIETGLTDGPRISPAGEGSVDLYWRLADRTLLVNFPAGAAPATYFGQGAQGDTAGGCISGKLSRAALGAWLTR